jgi:hypothetical protein
VPDKFIHYGLLNKEETIAYREYKSKIQSKNLVRDDADAINLGTFYPSYDAFNELLSDFVSIPLSYFVSNNMEFGKTYKLVAEITDNADEYLGTKGYISTTYNSQKNTFVYTEELLKNGRVYIYYGWDNYG